MAQTNPNAVKRVFVGAIVNVSSQYHPYLVQAVVRNNDATEVLGFVGVPVPTSQSFAKSGQSAGAPINFYNQYIPIGNVITPKADPGEVYVKANGTKAVGTKDGGLRLIFCSLGKPITVATTEEFDPDQWKKESA